jgi:hypothetical protein
MAANLEVTGAPAARITSTASTIADYAYPYGHLGHLTPKQEEAFIQFKKVLEERGLVKAGPPPSHDDPLILYVDLFLFKFMQLISTLTPLPTDVICARDDGLSRMLISNLKRPKTGARPTT